MEKITFENLPLAVSQLLDKLENIELLLQVKGNEHQPEADQFLTIQKAAEMLCLSVPTLYGLVHDAKIPVSKKGKRLYFSKQELTEWIKTGRKKTVSEISSEADNYLRKKRS